MAIEILLRFLSTLASVLRIPRYPIVFIEWQTIPLFIALYLMSITLVSRWKWEVEGDREEDAYQSVGQKTIVTCWLPSVNNLSAARQRHTSNFATFWDPISKAIHHSQKPMPSVFKRPHCSSSYLCFDKYFFSILCPPNHSVIFSWLQVIIYVNKLSMNCSWHSLDATWSLITYL